MTQRPPLTEARNVGGLGPDDAPFTPRVLLSYHYFKKNDLDATFAIDFPMGHPDVFADSGAYSSFTLGSAINVDEYAQWLSRWKRLFTVYASLDVIGDAEASYRNLRIMEDKYGLRPVPAFHAGEPFSYLERYVAEYDYVALGGMVGATTRTLMPWLVKCFRVAHDSGRVVAFHGFGLTSDYALKSLPWYSMDSTSWEAGFRYGMLHLFDPIAKSIIRVQPRDRLSLGRNARVLRHYGYTPADIAAQVEHRDVDLVGSMSAASFVLFEQFLRERHGPIPRMPLGQETTYGPRVYLAAAQARHLRLVGRTHSTLLAKE